LIPEPGGSKARAIEPWWRARGDRMDEVALFLALALGELAPSDECAARLLSEAVGRVGAVERRAWGELVESKIGWRTESDPIRALAALGLAFGEDSLREWLARPDESGRFVLDGVFGGDARKLAHAGRALLGASA
jgi:hypothetical protein